MERQNRSAEIVACYLEQHPKVQRVWYPGLSSHPDHDIALEQMDGFGGVVSFEIRPMADEPSLNTTSRFIDATTIPLIAPSLGGVESLIEQPALMSYYEFSTEERLEVGIKDNLVRLAIGIEDTDDILADLEQALAQV
jgi:cystathionine gamma-synthase